MAPPARRLRTTYDPVNDLTLIRATYALRRALELVPADFVTLMELQRVYRVRSMYEAELPLLDRLLAVYPKNQHQAKVQEFSRSERPEYVEQTRCARPRQPGAIFSELDQIVTESLATGRVESAALLLERAYPPERASWEVIDRVATLWLHLGEPGRARAALAGGGVRRPACHPGRADRYDLSGRWRLHVGSTFL